MEEKDGKKKWFCFSFYAIPIIFCFVSCKAVWILTVKEKKKVEAKGFFFLRKKNDDWIKIEWKAREMKLPRNKKKKKTRLKHLFLEPFAINLFLINNQ